MRWNRIVVGLVTAAGLIGLAACGGDGDGGGSGGDSSDLCSYAQELEASMSADAFGAMDEATFDQAQEIIANVQERAPEEIRADVATVADSFADVREIFAEYDFDLTQLAAAAAEDPDLAARLEAFGQGDFDAAAERVDAYLEENCGIESGS